MVWKLFGDDIGSSEGMDTSTKKRSVFPPPSFSLRFPSLLSFSQRKKTKGNVQGKEGCWSEKDVGQKGEAVTIQEDEKKVYISADYM